MTAIPEEILEIRQWTYSYSSEELKRPKYTKYKPEGAMTYKEVVDALDDLPVTTLMGFYVTDKDPYILGDIDKIENPNNPFEELPPELAYLLKTKETYSELSPSGKGIRFLLKFMSVDEKKKLEGKVFKTCEEVKDKNSIQINIGSPWMTITGNATKFSSSRIAITSKDELARCYDLKEIRTKEPIDAATLAIDKLPVTPFSKLRQAVRSLPLDQNPRIKRAYKETFKSSYDHYDFWISVMAGLKYYAKVSQRDVDCLTLLIEWSRLDPVAYTGDEDVRKHWESFKREDDGTQKVITEKSILKVAYYNTLFWPIPKAQTDSERDLGLPFKPLTTEYVNFKALIDFYDLAIYQNELEIKSYFISGDSDVMEASFKSFKIGYHYGKYYGPMDKKTLIPLFNIFLQHFGFTGIGHGRVREFIENWVVEIKPEAKVNLMKMYFDTEFKLLPEEYRENEDEYETSNFGRLFDCIKVEYRTRDKKRELALYRKYYKCWLMGLTRNLYYTGPTSENNCLLLLTGREQIRKTSHFKFLLPKFLKSYVAFTTHNFANENSVRDIVKLASNNLMIVWNELERYLNSRTTEANFKEVIDNNPQKFIDKFEVTETEVQPKAIYGATSNQSKFNIGTTGSRRLFHIPVKWVDTETMGKLCWHPIIAELKKEMEEGLHIPNSLPWLLTEEELVYQATLHDMIRSKEDVDLILEEIYDFDKPLNLDNGCLPKVKAFRSDTSGTLKTLRMIIRDLEVAGIRMHEVKRTALTAALERVCSSYTGSQRFSVSLRKPNCTIVAGQAIQGDRKLWVMPPLRSTDLDRKAEAAERAKLVWGKHDNT